MADKNSQHHHQAANQNKKPAKKQMSWHSDDSDTDEHYISKSQAKRDVEALQDLGAKLVELSRNSLEKFELDQRLKDEILVAQSIRSHSAKRRQMQLIGKIMRNVDAEKIQNQYDRYQNQLNETNAKFHQLEHWRDRLLQEGDQATNELVEKYPAFDRSRLRQLLRNAKKESDANKPPKSARQIFQYLKEIIEGQ
jgi:ribosome-associated protein